jgi:hypothetical protein
VVGAVGSTGGGSRVQVNGKVERYQQTLKREWALGQIYQSSDHRADALT